VKTNISIRKVLVVIAWLAIGSGLLTLLVAANRKEQKHFCKDVAIRIKGTGDIFYIDKGDIITILKNGSDQKMIGQPLNKMNLARMEKLLEKSSWVADAELYFDSHDVLHITATERQPIARIFTKAGTSYYIDSATKRMPLLQKMSIRVPLVTNFPGSKKIGPQDSALLRDVKELTAFISSDPFWNAQVAQLDIVGERNFELIPTIGNHVIRLGTAEDLEEKFNRLFIFYKNVLSKTGFDHYSVIDVQYKDQVVATQKGSVSKVDALQLQKNIEELMKKAQQAQEAQQPMVIDSTIQLQTNNSNEAFDAAQVKEGIEKPASLKQSNFATNTTTKPSPTLKKTTAKPNALERKIEVNKNVVKPKAVMKRKTSP
jgi:cell division protein FtsQ